MQLFYLLLGKLRTFLKQFVLFIHTQKKEKRRNWRAKTFEQNLLEWVKGILKNERLFRFLSWIFDSLKNEPFTQFSEHYNACLSRLFRHLNNLYPKLQWQIPTFTIRLTLFKPFNILKECTFSKCQKLLRNVWVIK